MIVAAAIIVALVCVAASARRLWFAATPTVVHPNDVLEMLGKAPGPAEIERLKAAVEGEPDADWERDLLAAITATPAEVRAALVNEQLTELDLRMQRWARVPRVCASIATSVGILLGTLVLRAGLAAAGADDVVIDETLVRGILSDAISVVSFGIVGTAFCIGAHTHARRMTKARQEAADKMIEKLEAAVGNA
jgi:hypothetical protein